MGLVGSVLVPYAPSREAQPLGEVFERSVASDNGGKACREHGRDCPALPGGPAAGLVRLERSFDAPAGSGHADQNGKRHEGGCVAAVEGQLFRCGGGVGSTATDARCPRCWGRCRSGPLGPVVEAVVARGFGREPHLGRDAGGAALRVAGPRFRQIQRPVDERVPCRSDVRQIHRDLRVSSRSGRRLNIYRPDHWLRETVRSGDDCPRCRHVEASGLQEVSVVALTVTTAANGAGRRTTSTATG